MLDPSRIPRVLEELRDTWEGQPRLSLPALFGALELRGIGWTSTDEELIQALQDLRATYPSRISQIEPGTCVRVQTDGSVVYIDHRDVITLPGGEVRPSVWHYASIDVCEVGRPLRLTTADEVNARLGVVEALNPMTIPRAGLSLNSTEGAAQPQPWFAADIDPHGVRLLIDIESEDSHPHAAPSAAETTSDRSIGDARDQARECRCMLGHDIHTWVQGRRETQHASRGWDRIGPVALNRLVIVDGRSLGRARAVWVLPQFSDLIW